MGDCGPQDPSNPMPCDPQGEQDRDFCPECDAVADRDRAGWAYCPECGWDETD